MSTKPAILGLFLILATWPIPTNAYAPVYRVHCLGCLPGTYTSAATGINRVGQALGWSNSASDARGMFLWSKEYGMSSIWVPGAMDYPGGIDGSGRVVGTAASSQGPQSAVLRASDGHITVLPNLPDAVDSSGSAINDGGQTVGRSGAYAALWSNTGSVFKIGGDTESPGRATAINNNGQVTWVQELSGGLKRAYRWDSVNGSVLLAQLEGTGSSVANAISNAGWIAGRSGNRAVLWNPSGSALDLGTSSLQWGNEAYGINDHGQIVGELGGRAVLWNSDGGIAADLDSFLGQEYGSGAYAINDDGWVAGYQLDEYGNQQAVVWEPVPEPSGLSALSAVVGCLAMAARRRRS